MESRKLNDSLHAAVRSRNRELVQSLLKDGADANALDYSRGKTCIDTAVDNSDVELVRLLLRAGASPNLRRNRYVDAPRRSPLIRSVIAGNSEIIRLLINAGASLNVTDQRQRNCMHYAAERKSTKIAQILLRAGVTASTINCADQQTNSPLMIAVKSQNVEMTKLLLEAGALVSYGVRDEYLRNWDVDTIHEAVKIGNKDITRLLLEHGALIDMRTLLLALDKETRLGEGTKADLFLLMLLYASDDLKADKELAELVFVAALKSGSVSAINLLSEHGVIRRHRSKLNSLNPLHKVIRDGNEDLLKALLSQNMFDIEKEDSHHSTPLLTAIAVNNPGIVKTLVKAGANVNHEITVITRTVSPLIAAFVKKNTAVIKLLLEAGAAYDSVFSCITCQSFSSVVNCIIQHIALLKTRGYSIKPEHLSTIENTESLRKFFSICCSELSEMQKSIVHDSVTFYSLISDSNIKASANEELVIKTLRSTHVLELFPNYGEKVLSCYAKVWGKPRLMEDAAIGLSRLTGLDPYAFHVILYKILHLLPKADRCNLRLISLT